MTKERTLTEKEERFCLSFAKTANATAAAIEAGYSKNSAGVTASRKLRKANIKARLPKTKYYQRVYLAMPLVYPCLLFLP